MRGCPHHAEVACPECLDIQQAQPEFIKPHEGESLESFLARTGNKATQTSAPGYVEPSLDEQKRIIRDETVPEAVRRYWRERLYGKGGAGRKGLQQENLQRRTVIEGQRITGPSATKALGGRQRKMARRLLRRMAKIAQNAA